MDATAWFARGTSQYRVMVVDDEPLVRASLADMVEIAGYQCCGQASDGYEATRLVHDCNPDVVLMDLFMPTMDGIEALQIINVTRPTCAIVLTAHCSPQLVRDAAAAGAQGYLIKPCRPLDLVPAIETAVAQFERSRVAAECERIDALVGRAWAHIEAGGSPAAAVERALAAACQVIGRPSYALLARRGTRMQVRSARGLRSGVAGSLLGPCSGALGMSLRRAAPCELRLAGAPTEQAAALVAPVLARPALEGCLCLLAPEGTHFSEREGRLAGLAARSVAWLLQRAASERAAAWHRWARPALAPALAGRR